MTRYIYLLLFLFGSSHAIYAAAEGADSAVPKPFQKSDPTSTYTISYADLDELLKAAVTDVGRSTREKAAPTQAKTGTRMKPSVKRSTINEGNRFQYEAFQGSEELRKILRDTRDSLEQIPASVPLEYFNRNEQLAYWMNLYNFTLLNEIVAIYPKRNLKKVLVGKKSILNKKLLKVAGVELSLSDIQFNILRNNYDNNPLIMYGLYQGIIGGPNIRKRAYTGENVYRYLRLNAVEFINSNRGTYAEDEYVFKVSNLYKRNEIYFDDFEPDLTKHLMSFIEGEERGYLQSAERIKPNIEDWTVTDLYGTYSQIGGSLANNKAALVDSVRNTQPGDTLGSTISGNFSNASGMVTSKAPGSSRFSPELVLQLQEIQRKEQITNKENARVTVEEIYPPVETPEDPDEQEKENN
jgi:hypothetical protein